MEFQEVKRLVTQKNISTTALRDLSFGDDSADNLGISPYQSQLAYLPLSTYPKRGQQIASRLVSTVRRLGRSTRKRQGSLTSDDDMLTVLHGGKAAGKRWKVVDDRFGFRSKGRPRQRRLLSRIKEHHNSANSSNYTSGGEDNVATGYVSMDEAYMHTRRRRRGRVRKDNFLRKLQTKRKNARLFPRNRIETELSVTRKDSITLSPLDLHRIHDQMQTFSVPESWAHFDNHSVSNALSNMYDAPISSERIIQKLCSDIKQMQNLVCSQGNKIASCKEEIEGYITKLQTLDQQVQLLNTKITQRRQDSRDRMLQTLQQTSQRKPQMQKAHTRHERLVTSIENYRKGANYLIRLSNLDKRVKAARRRQDIWDALQSWIPTVAILILTVLISLLVSLCRSY